MLRAAPPETGGKIMPLRVMVVDDSVVIRGFLSRWIEAESDMTVVASLRTGRDAVNQIDRVSPDVAILDIEMPDLDGISALPQLIAKKRDLVVIMASTLTRRNAEISLKALSLGAADYIPKPESAQSLASTDAFHHELIQKIRSLGRRSQSSARTMRSPPLAPDVPPRLPHSNGLLSPAVSPPIRLLPFNPYPPRALLIGSSTGGPQALMKIATDLGPVIDRHPVLITQHMPPTFTTILAEHLARVSQRPAREGVDGETVRPGQIYLAPGGKHMCVARRGAEIVVVLNDEPPINYCKPAVDPLFQSAAAIWQGGVLATILTGMGADGMRGAKDIVAAGGNVIVQDEASSVVWGMPGAAAHAGVCAAVLPLDQIASKLNKLFLGDRA